MTITINGNTGFDSDSSLGISTNETNAITVDSSQNVGIGTASPATTLNLGDSGVLRINNPNGTRNLELFNDSNHAEIKSSVDPIRINAEHSSGYVRFDTDTTQRARIEADGDFVLGSTSNHTFIRPYETSTGNLIIGSDQGATGTSGSDLIFRSRGTERVRIRSGGGLTFNGDTAAANALDDYEEGTFTPYFSGFALVSYDTNGQVGAYVKIGRLVYVYGRLAYTSRTPSSNVAIQGLPFNRDISVLGNNSADIRIYVGGGARNHAPAYSTTNGYYPCTEGQSTASTDPFGASADIYFHMTYTASS